MAAVYLLTGGNRGDRTGYLKRAAELVEEQIGKTGKRSSVYETEPWGLKDSCNFYNQVLMVSTSLTPVQVLDAIHSIEKELGRKRSGDQSTPGDQPSGDKYFTGEHTSPGSQFPGTENNTAGGCSPGEGLSPSGIDEQAGANRPGGGKYAPRTIDIDILFYDDLVLMIEELTIPHPGIEQRRFVLEPLNEIAPGLVHPGNGKTVSQLLSECEDPLEVKRKDDDGRE